MKNLKIYMLLGIAVFLTSCSEDDKSTIIVQNTVSTGAILRTIVEDGDFDIFRTANVIDITVEEQDLENGALLDRVDLSLSFVDNNFLDEDAESDRESVLLTAFKTIPVADFAAGGDQGLPRNSFNYTLAEALTTLGVDLTQVLPGDQIVLDLELFLTDGRSFDFNDGTGNVSGGSFFSSPFQYVQLIDDGIEFVVEDVNANEISLTNPNVDFIADISIDDADMGATLQTLNIYRAFVDRSIEDDMINRSEPEALFDTYEIADLTLEEGARTITLNYTQDMLYGGNITFADLGVNDEVQLRYELVTADGRIVTTDENDTEYYFPIIVSECIQLNADAPYPGEYTFNMFDSAEDGWDDNARIEASIDGGDPITIQLAGGADGTDTLTVPEGATSFVLTFISGGQFDSEITFTIQDPNLKTAAAGGPTPTPGEIVLLVCE